MRRRRQTKRRPIAKRPKLTASLKNIPILPVGSRTAGSKLGVMAIAPPSYECWTKEDWFGKGAQGTNLWIKSYKKLKMQSLIGQRIIKWRFWTLKQKPRGLVRGHRLRCRGRKLGDARLAD